MRYESGPGRKWLLFLAGAGMWACLFALGARPGAAANAVLQAGRASFAAAFLGLAWWSRRAGVAVEGDEIVVRHWSRTHRVRMQDVRDVELDPVSPHLALTDGTRLPLLDSWHADPGLVGAEVRRRWLARRDG